MPDLASITLPNNVTYNFKDEEARTASKKVFTASATWQGTEAQCEFDDGGSYSEIVAILEDGGFPVIRLEQSSGEYVECYPSGYDADGNLQFFGIILGNTPKVVYTDLGGGETQFFVYVYEPNDELPPNSASINSSGLITFKHGTLPLFTLQLPIYAPTVLTITFEIAGAEDCIAEDGMTWADWVASDYNTCNCMIQGPNVLYNGNANNLIAYNYSPVLSTDEIISGATYTVSTGGGQND